MALTCLRCRHYRREAVVDGVLRCVHCGHRSGPARLPLLVVTGAAAAGKSTVCASLAGRPGLLALDGDVLADGAAAVSGGRRDYSAFWRYLLDVAREIGDNGLCVAYCCVCLPEQVLANAEIAHFTGVHFLALVSDATTVRVRIRHRQGAPSAVGRLAVHVAVNDVLRTATVPAPHTITPLDTTGLAPGDTIAAAAAWAAEILARSPDHSAGRPPNELR